MFRADPPRESMPTGGRDFGLVWSVGTGIDAWRSVLYSSPNSRFVERVLCFYRDHLAEFRDVQTRI